MYSACRCLCIVLNHGLVPVYSNRLKLMSVCRLFCMMVASMRRDIAIEVCPVGQRQSSSL